MFLSLWYEVIRSQEPKRIGMSYDANILNKCMWQPSKFDHWQYGKLQPEEGSNPPCLRFLFSFGVIAAFNYSIAAERVHHYRW